MVITTTRAGKAHAPPGAETQQIWLKRLGPAGAAGGASMAVRLRVGFSRLVASPYCSSNLHQVDKLNRSLFFRSVNA